MAGPRSVHDPAHCGHRRTASPPLFATMQVLGRDLCLSRLEDAVALLQK